MMLDSFVKFNEIDASLHELSIRNQKCENADDDVDGDMIPTCRPCLAGDTKPDHRCNECLAILAMSEIIMCEDLVPYFHMCEDLLPILHT